MKRFLFIIVIIGICIGIFITIRENSLKNDVVVINEEKEETSYIDELNIPIIEVDTLNPIFTQNKQVSDVLKNIYEPLININNGNNIEPCLAFEWNEKSDTSWIIKIRNDVKWHSGKDFSINDVIFTMKTIMQSEASKYNLNLRNVSSIEKIDANSILINLYEKDSLFPYMLTFPIIPEYYWKNDIANDNKANKPIGTGPYKYVSTSNDGIRFHFEYNNQWWNSKTHKLNNMYVYKYNTYGEAVKAFKSNEIDIISTSMISWEKKFGVIGINSYKYENSEFEVLIPNSKNTILTDSSVRRALLHAINRENIINVVYDGMANVADIPIHNYSSFYLADNTTEYNLDKARQLLINSGWTQKDRAWIKNINSKEYKLKLSIMVNKENEEKMKVVENIKNDLEEFGVNITINKVDWKTYSNNLLNQKFDLALASFETQTDFDIIEMINPNSTNNYAKLNNDNMNSVLENFNLSNIYLKEKFQSLQLKYKEEIPYIGLYYKTNVLLTNKSVKGDITPTWWNTFNNIYNWCK